MFDHSLLTTPGAIIGYRKSGAPIRLIAGGSGEGDGSGGDGGGAAGGSQFGGEGQPQDGGAQQDGGTSAAGVTHPDRSSWINPDEPINPDAIKVDQLPAWGQKLFRDLRKEAADYRSKMADAQKAADEAAKKAGPSPEEVTAQVRADFAQQIGQALGLIGGEQEKQLTPEQVIDQLTAEKDTTAKERDQEKERHRRALIELAVHRAGSQMGADPEALLDSRSFVKKVRDLDPDGEDFATKLGEVIQLAIDEHPKYKAGSLAGPPPRSGGEFAGGPGARPSGSEPTIDDFRKRRAAAAKEKSS
ncbi:hypothetical protein [Nonomuraea wenchangensis]|uniref:Uncharacterized protein n=1 Tax=Nonomuraea wenchangensis TaxID=568860 RepID=A0A1I0LTX1_9ACTN|nr:hypothetical protein [Nonomuraea wenchangensis]SEU46592.1 hypothetical protein SAMN05421811_12788 [Nonomuraea wenchangensis]